MDETILSESPANLWRGPEAVGGRLLVTSEALVFRSHALNIQTGETRLPLREITDVRPVNTLKIIPNGLEVSMRSGERHRLVVGGRSRLLTTIEAARSAANAAPPVFHDPRG